MEIKPYESHHLEAVVRLSLRAWEPVFESIRKEMDTKVFDRMHQPSWQVTQQQAVEDVCQDQEIPVWVAMEGETVMGFTALKFHRESLLGEVYMIAVDPDFQRRGIAKALSEHALEIFTKAGMTVAMVETGGDAGHAPARRTYESTGYRLLPIARYFKAL